MTRTTPPFGRVLTAMATPFDAAGRLDAAGAAVLARHLVEHGSDGLVVCGSTGESPTLSDDERAELVEAVVGAVTAPVVVGTTTADTAHSLALTRTAGALGAAGILAVCPYYNRPSQAGLEAHFRAVAGATDLPVVLYDIPVRTGRKIAGETILSLAREVPNIVGLKDAAGDVAATGRLLAAAPPGFSCYSGEDALTLPLISVGAGGLIGVATHWCARECGEMIERYDKGDVAGALELHRALLDSFAYETGDDAPNPVPTKVMLGVLGLPGGECRLPLGPPPPGLRERAEAVLSGLEAFRVQRDMRA